jgi:hypothetical protein
MFVDDGAAVNVMPYTTFGKLGMGLGELTPTSIVLNDFAGNPSDSKGCVLTPKNGTGKGLTSGPSLLMKYHSARKDLLRGFGKSCLRLAMRHHSAKGLFALFGNAW